MKKITLILLSWLDRFIDEGRVSPDQYPVFRQLLKNIAASNEEKIVLKLK